MAHSPSHENEPPNFAAICPLQLKLPFWLICRAHVRLFPDVRQRMLLRHSSRRSLALPHTHAHDGPFLYHWQSFGRAHSCIGVSCLGSDRRGYFLFIFIFFCCCGGTHTETSGSYFATSATLCKPICGAKQHLEQQRGQPATAAAASATAAATGAKRCQRWRSFSQQHD